MNYHSKKKKRYNSACNLETHKMLQERNTSLDQKDIVEEKQPQEITDENKDDKIWWFLLAGLLQDATEDKWNDFVYQLMYKNRFSSSHEVVDLIRNIGETVSKTIPKGTKLYRARIFNENTLGKVIDDLTGTKQKDKKAQSTKKIYLYPIIGLLSEDKETTLRYRIVDRFEKEYSKWQKKKFKGYNAKDSGKPPKDKAIEGRVNPPLISYLYLAEDPITSIYEVHPAIGQYVSVAEFVTKRDLKIYDFAFFFPADYENEKKLDIALFNHISQMFSLPYQQKPLQYLPTQCLAEIIKNSGFDGLRFKSSLHQDGNNIVLFDDEFCKPISSDYIQVNGIDLTLVKPEMYELGEMISSANNIEGNK